MKKCIALLTACVVVACSFPAYASSIDMEQKIEELEQRIVILEQMLGVSPEETPSETPSSETAGQTTAEAITLGVGTWIVGEDLAPGKYNLTCPSGYSYIKIYNSYEDRKLKDYSYIESYMMANEDYLNEAFSYLDEDAIKTYEAFYSYDVSNVRLDNDMCIYIENGSIDFTPVG